MEAAFNCTQRFVKPPAGTYHKNEQNWTYGPKSVVFNHFNVYFQQ